MLKLWISESHAALSRSMYTTTKFQEPCPSTTAKLLKQSYGSFTDQDYISDEDITYQRRRLINYYRQNYEKPTEYYSLVKYQYSETCIRGHKQPAETFPN